MEGIEILVSTSKKMDDRTFTLKDIEFAFKVIDEFMPDRVASAILRDTSFIGAEDFFKKYKETHGDSGTQLKFNIPSVIGRISGALSGMASAYREEADKASFRKALKEELKKELKEELLQELKQK